MFKNILNDHQKIYTHTYTHVYIHTHIHTYNCINTVRVPVLKFLVYILLIPDSIGNSLVSLSFSANICTNDLVAATSPRHHVLYLVLRLPACGHVFVACAGSQRQRVSASLGRSVWPAAGCGTVTTAGGVRLWLAHCSIFPGRAGTASDVSDLTEVWRWDAALSPVWDRTRAVICRAASASETGTEWTELGRPAVSYPDYTSRKERKFWTENCIGV